MRAVAYGVNDGARYSGLQAPVSHWSPLGLQTVPLGKYECEQTQPERSSVHRLPLSQPSGSLLMHVPDAAAGVAEQVDVACEAVVVALRRARPRSIAAEPCTPRSAT